MTGLIEACVNAGQPLSTLPSTKPNVMICTPCHSGKIDINYHLSILLMGAVMQKNGIDYMVDYNVGMSIDWARSQMATSFLKTECTHLLFIDDDIAFAPDLPFRLLQENVDIVAVPYTRKTRNAKYNIRHGVRVEKMPGRPYMMTVESIATGMMMIRRNVLETLAPKVPEFLYDHNGDKGRLFFRHELVDDEMVGGVSYMGEDYNFCRLARANGFKIWAHVDEELAHIGPYAYKAKYSDEAQKGQSEQFTNDRPRMDLRLITQ